MKSNKKSEVNKECPRAVAVVDELKTYETIAWKKETKIMVQIRTNAMTHVHVIETRSDCNELDPFQIN